MNMGIASLPAKAPIYEDSAKRRTIMSGASRRNAPTDVKSQGEPHFK